MCMILYFVHCAQMVDDLSKWVSCMLLVPVKKGTLKIKKSVWQTIEGQERLDSFFSILKDFSDEFSNISPFSPLLFQNSEQNALCLTAGKFVFWKRN